MSSGVRSQSAWLFGPLPDLFLGCGLAYVAVFGLLMIAGPEMRALLPLGMLPLLTLVTSTPHYGATILRVYEERESRRAYALFSVWATLVILALSLGALKWHVVGSWLLTLYLTWSPWHYTGQNYGLAVMFLRRRDVTITPTAKRLFYASFLFSFLLTLLVVHGDSLSGAVYAPNAPTTAVKDFSNAFRFIPLGIPLAVQRPLLALCLGAYFITLVASGVLLARGGSLRALLPSAVLVLTQSLWFTVPTLTRYWGLGGGLDPLGWQHATYAFFFVIFGHSIQYLWVTSYYARRSGQSRGQSIYLLKCVLAGAALFAIPEMVLSPATLGPLPYDDGLALLIAASVNLHHFVLDGAVWKLRDSKVASVLIRAPETTSQAAPLGPSGRSWIKPLAWLAGVAGVVIVIVGTLETNSFRYALAYGDSSRLERAATRLSWIGRNNSEAHRELGRLALERGDLDTAERELVESLELWRHPQSWVLLGRTYTRRGQGQRALQAFSEAYALDSYPAVVVGWYARTLLTTGDPQTARDVLRAGLADHPEDVTLRKLARTADARLGAD
jgi:hypothetical protein